MVLSTSLQLLARESHYMAWEYDEANDETVYEWAMTYVARQIRLRLQLTEARVYGQFLSVDILSRL